jgi:Ca-activated chloride channel family protein
LGTAKYTSQPVDTVQFRLHVETTAPLKSIYSPTHEVSVQRLDDCHATVSMTQERVVPANDFRLLYDVGKQVVGASLMSYRPDAHEPGYFVLLASPRFDDSKSDRTGKDIVLVVDRSGSMQGKKIEQARGAARYVLDNLNDHDRFNIIAYSTAVESYKPELQAASDSTARKQVGAELR